MPISAWICMGSLIVYRMRATKLRSCAAWEVIGSARLPTICGSQHSKADSASVQIIQLCSFTGTGTRLLTPLPLVQHQVLPVAFFVARGRRSGHHHPA